jgi:broad specificity phosphatase PhoE
MNRVFYIFRHGETDWNREGRCQGHTDIELNETGLRQAQDLALKMLNFPLDVVVTSDLLRAAKTGAVVAEKQGVPLIVDSRLREMSYGEVEGRLLTEVRSIYGNELGHIDFPGGENRKLVRERISAVLLELIENSIHKSIGISTHGGALRNILHSFLPDDYPKLPIPNCVVYRCEYNSKLKTFLVDSKPL